jgi:hypothetical protein
MTCLKKNILMILLLGWFSCKDDTKKDHVFEEFKSQIENKGMKIDSVDATGLIFIKKGDLTLKISLGNLRKDYERDKDKTYITDFVKTITSYTVETPSTWAEVRDHIYISLFPNDSISTEFIHKKITDEIGKVYVYNEEDKLTWITKDDLRKWTITEAVLENQANINANKLLDEAEIAFDLIDGKKLGRIESKSPSLKGALLFAPEMKNKVRDNFGSPFYAVIPVRDFCYIFSEKDYDFFSNRIGKVVVEEFKDSGYPVSTELLKFTDLGVEAIGGYPVNK